MITTVKAGMLRPGLLVKKDPDEYNTFLVMRDRGEIFLKNICTGDDEFPENISYMIVGKKRSEDIFVRQISWGCREDFPMEDLREILKERSDQRKKTYVCFPDDGSDSYMAVFTSMQVTDDEGYYLLLACSDRLFGM